MIHQRWVLDLTRTAPFNRFAVAIRSSRPLSQRGNKTLTAFGTIVLFDRILGHSMTKRLVTVAGSIGVACLCLALLWATRHSSLRPIGHVKIGFAGLTNNTFYGPALAQFRITNDLSRGVRVGVGAVQVRGITGWPNSMQVMGGSNWLVVPAGSNLVFSVLVPDGQRTIWRVPLLYEEDRVPIEALFDRISGLAYGIAHHTPGRRFSLQALRHFSFMTSPEMLGASPETMSDKLPEAEILNARVRTNDLRSTDKTPP